MKNKYALGFQNETFTEIDLQKFVDILLIVANKRTREFCETVFFQKSSSPFARTFAEIKEFFTTTITSIVTYPSTVKFNPIFFIGNGTNNVRYLHLLDILRFLIITMPTKRNRALVINMEDTFAVDRKISFAARSKRLYSCVRINGNIINFQTVIDTIITGKNVSFYFEDWISEEDDDCCQCEETSCICWHYVDGEFLPRKKKWIEYTKVHMVDPWKSLFFVKKGGTTIRRRLSIFGLIAFLCAYPPIRRDNCYSVGVNLGPLKSIKK